MNDHTVEERTFGDNLRVRVVYDMDGSSHNPREWFNITTIRGWHRRMDIGDGPNIDPDDYDSFADMIRTLESDDGPIVMLAPLYWYEHGGVTCDMGNPLHGLHGFGLLDDGPGMAAFRAEVMDDAGWDSGVAGVVYVTAKSLAEAGTDPADVEQVARAEVEQYAAWLRGEVYGYVVELTTTCDQGHDHNEVMDSCWGFVGEPDYCLSEGVATVGWQVVAAMLAGSFGRSPVRSGG